MALSTEEQERVISIWEKAVETQMHFNEMSVKSRQLGLTFVTAALGLAIVLLGNGKAFQLPISIFGCTVVLHASVLIIMSAFLALLAVRNLDLNVYHKMLRGAVTFGEDLEENYIKQIVDLEKGMTQTISHFSRYSDANKMTPKGTTKYTYSGGTPISAEKKIRHFYTGTLVSLFIASVSLFAITNQPNWSAVPQIGEVTELVDQREIPEIDAEK